MEPDLKNGHGGLRDVQLIDALAAAQLVDRPSRDVLRGARPAAGRAHRAAPPGRAGPATCCAPRTPTRWRRALEIGDRFELARALSGAARAVAFAAEVGLRSARTALPRRGLAALRRPPVRRPLDGGVVEHAGEVALARDAAAARDPALVLRVAATAARTGLPVAAGHAAPARRHRARAARAVAAGGARRAAVAAGHAGRALVDVVESLDRTGLWGRLFPEWGAVRDLPPRDRAHVWTVDRHLVEACAQARAADHPGRPAGPAAGRRLLHDIGKGRGGDHSVVGESLAVQIGRRLGFAERTSRSSAPMVRHHLLLPHTATRRDLDDPATVVRVVETLEQAVPGAGALLLDLLDALAEADSLATGPGVWSPWKRVLIGDLVAPVPRAAGGRARCPRPPRRRRREIEMAAAVAAERTSAAAPGRRGDPATVTVALPRPHRRARRGRGRARAALAGGARGRRSCPRTSRAPPSRCSASP